MFVQSLESRRLMAASATLTNGVLGVVGTSGSDRIEIRAYYTVKLASNNRTVTSSTLNYNVLVNNNGVGVFNAADVSRINVFALGGNDRVIGPNDAPSVVVSLTSGNGGTVNAYAGTSDGTTVTIGNPLTAGRPASPVGSIAAAAAVPVYVEGGSGRDLIYGGRGNDTLKGDAGDDVIVDSQGRNYLDGGTGDDQIFTTRVVLRGSPSVTAFSYSVVGVTGVSRILAGEGTDTVLSSGRDDLLDVPESNSVTLGNLAAATRH